MHHAHTYNSTRKVYMMHAMVIRRWDEKANAQSYFDSCYRSVVGGQPFLDSMHGIVGVYIFCLFLFHSLDFWK